MVTAGVLHGIGGTEFIQGLKTPVTDPNLLTLAQKAQNALVDSLARSAVNTATDVIISGHDLDDALKSALLSTVAGVIGQVAANEIGDFYKKAPLDGSIDPLEYGLHKVMHAALGCGTAAISGANCAAGAAGGVAGAVVTEAFYDPSDKVVELTKKVKSGEITNAEKIKLLIEFKREGADMARLAAAFTALAVGVKSGEDVNAAANAGQNVAENNALETVWDLASLSMSLVELGVAINDGDALDIALAGGSVIIDGLSVLVPGVPGGAGYLLKASKTADGKLVAKVVDEAGDTYKVVDNKLYDDAGNIVKSTDNSASTGTKVTSNGASGSGGTNSGSTGNSGGNGHSGPHATQPLDHDILDRLDVNQIAEINKLYSNGQTIPGKDISTVIANASYREGGINQVASVIRDIAGGHLFQNGNKRTAQALAESFELNIPSTRIRSVIDAVGQGTLKNVDDIAMALKG